MWGDAGGKARGTLIPSGIVMFGLDPNIWLNQRWKSEWAPNLSQPDPRVSFHSPEDDGTSVSYSPGTSNIWPG